MDFYSIFWIVVMVLAAVVELATTALVSLWFVAGGLAALLFSLLGFSPVIQWLAFALVSLLVLCLFRSRIAGYMQKKHVATNADSLIGKVVTVKETIDNEREQGLLCLGDQEWSARTKEPGLILEPGTQVRILSIEGVKLIVEPVQKKTGEEA